MNTRANIISLSRRKCKNFRVTISVYCYLFVQYIIKYHIMLFCALI